MRLIYGKTLFPIVESLPPAQLLKKLAASQIPGEDCILRMPVLAKVGLSQAAE